MTVVDLFAGAGGWDVAARDVGLHPFGIECDAHAVATRRANGLWTFDHTLTLALPFPDADVTGIIASPPCTAFSAAGKRQGQPWAEHLCAVVRGEEALSDDCPELAWLSIVPWIWVDHHRPRWVAWEQVPSVMPLWEAAADRLAGQGYSAWAGVLSAEEYGVPQVRKRAFLIAAQDHEVGPPPPTHARYRKGHPPDTDGGRLLPWVSMADALGWGGLWSRVLNTGRDWKPGGDRDDAQTVAPDQPSPAVTGIAVGQWQWAWERPATTVAGDARVWPPGHKVNQRDRDRLGEAEANARYGDRAGTDAIRVTPEEAAILQGFPPDFEFTGGKTSRARQIGNAVPPPLAAAVLRAATGGAHA